MSIGHVRHSLDLLAVDHPKASRRKDALHVGDPPGNVAGMDVLPRYFEGVVMQEDPENQAGKASGATSSWNRYPLSCWLRSGHVGGGAVDAMAPLGVAAEADHVHGVTARYADVEMIARARHDGLLTVPCTTVHATQRVRGHASGE